MPIDDNAVCMAILFSSSKKRMGSGRSYAGGGPREEQANNGTWWIGTKSGAGASQATRKIGVTVAVTVVCRNGRWPT